jgi:hypothetical protein
MIEPALPPLDYASPTTRPAICPAKLTIACICWALPLPLAVLLIRLPPEFHIAAAVVVMGFPFAAACYLAGLGILPEGHRWRWFCRIMLPMLLITAWRAYHFLRTIDFD